MSKTKEEKIYSIDPTKIYTLPNRHRQIFNPKKLAELVNSIKNIGQIQLGVCRLNGKRVELVVGERRLRACEEIGIDFKFILEEEIKDPLLLERIQLEENLVREDLEWKEEIRAKQRIFNILKESDSSQTVQSVADYLGIGKSILSEDISLAIWVNENEEVASAPNKTTAKKIIKRLVTTIVRDEALEESLEKTKAKTMKLLTERQEEEIEKGKEPTPIEELTLDETKILMYDSKCLLGDMEEKLESFPDKHFDLVFFDPPWGVEYDKNQEGTENQKKFSDLTADFV